PMDIMGRSNRFSYAAAWGCIAFLVSDVIFQQKYAVNLPGPFFMKVFYALLSMLIYGLDYLPLFVSLSVDCIFGYMVGTVYACLFTGITIFKAAECQMTTIHRSIDIIKILPLLLCELYLSASYTVRLILSIRQKKKFFTTMQILSVFEVEKSVYESWEGKHVINLLRHHPLGPPASGTVREKVVSSVKSLINTWLYQRQPDFRYSTRVLSVLLIGAMVMYKSSVELLWVSINQFEYAEEKLIFTLKGIGITPQAGEAIDVAFVRQYICLILDVIPALKGSFIAAVTLATLVGFVMILHMLSSYRTNLLKLYRGDNSDIPPKSHMSNPHLLVGSMRYAGYQVGYIAWGYLIQVLVYLLIAVILAFVVTLIMNGIYQWLIRILMELWPVLLTTILINILQTMMAKCLFLQQNGQILRLDNRRLLFLVTYFMFFYNIFMGFLSCLMRILKSTIIGASLLSRLDQSILPKNFQKFDSGFNAYIGFMHVEVGHTHPVVIVFLRLLVLDVGIRKGIKMELEKGSKADDVKTTVATKRRFMRARNNWQMTYTLLNNPSLKQYRQHHIQHSGATWDSKRKPSTVNHNTVSFRMPQINSPDDNVAFEMAKADEYVRF
ncbi:hypothetical protein ACJMK2_018197, partial [Sinanodonta woodiana]